MRFWHEHFRRYFTAYLVLALSLAPAFFLLFKLKGAVAAQLESRFNEESGRIKTELRDNIELGLQPIRAASGFFAADPAAPRVAWDRFVERLGVREARSWQRLGLMDLGLIWRVNAEDRAEKMRHWQGLGYASVLENPRFEGRENFCSILLENFEGRQPLDQGWSADVEGKIRLAMETARDTGQAASTEVVELFQMGKQARAAGLVVLEPVYEGPTPGTAAGRRKQLLGFVYGSLVPAGAWDSADKPGAKARVSWTLSAFPESGGVALRSYAELTGASEKPRWVRAESVNLLGRLWQLDLKSTPTLERSPEGALPWVIFIAGVTVSGALFLIALSQVRARLAAEKHAEILSRADDAMLREKRFSEAILNDLPGLFLLLDDAGRLVRWNRYLEEVTGLAGSELRALQGGELFGAANMGRVQESLAEVFRNGHARMEIRLRAKEGKPVPYHLTGYRFQSANRSFCIGIGLDVREQEEAREFEPVHQLMRQVIACAQQGVVVFDRNLRYVVWNPYMEKISGVRGEHAVGKTPSQLFPPELAEILETHLRKALLGNAVEAPPYEARFGEENPPVWLTSTYGPVTAADGSVIGVIEMARDVSAERKLEAERETMVRRLVENQKYESLGVLAGGIAHDFNNLLAGILGSANLVRMELDPKSPHQPLLQQIEESSKKAAGLCAQLLAYAGKGRFQIEPVDLTELVQNSASVLRHSIDPQCDLKISLAEGMPFVEADAQQLRQALMSLVVNSAESMEGRGGVIEISTRVASITRRSLESARVGSDLPTGIYVVLRVRDSGSGMDAATLEKIFDPFFTTKFPGRGLGLPSVLGIVRSHKGALTVESAPGTGTTFQIFLPPAQGRAPARKDPVSRPSVSITTASNPMRKPDAIMVVDDEPGVREITAKLIEAWGYPVSTAASGREAVERFRADPNSAGLVLMDLAMPDMDGATACRHIHSINPKVSVVVMSGFSAAQVAPHFSEDKISAFLQKPFNSDHLKEVLNSVLQGRGPGKRRPTGFKA